MKKQKIAMGPGAASLILIVVSLALCMLAMLTLVSARNDANLSEKSADMIEQVYLLSAQSERSLAALDAVIVRCRAEHPEEEDYLAAVEENLPDGMTLEDDVVSWSEPLDNRSLECAVKLLQNSAASRMEWVSHKLIVEEPEEDWEWD